MAAPKGRQRKKSTSRKKQLLEIAAKIFAEEGYKETGIDRILKQAGLTGPALYRHFSSKQEILDTLCVNELQDAVDLALKIHSAKGLSEEEKLRKLISMRIDHLLSPHGHSSILANSQRAHLSQEARKQVVELQQEFRAICGGMLKNVRPNATDTEIAMAFFAAQNMVVYTIRRSKERGILSENDMKKLLEKMVWNTFLA